jgi:hypothetical protein
VASKIPRPYEKLTAQAATFRTKALNVATATWIGYAIRTTGTLAGTWRVQYSNDFIDGVDDATSDAKWDEYTLTSNPPDAAGAAQTFGVVLDDYEYKYVRIKFTRSGGTGDVELWAQIKGN